MPPFFKVRFRTMLKNSPLIVKRQFRAPRHTISDAGLVGGGHMPKPGEVSLAHNRVLFLDEFPEFRRNVLDLLRQPLEDGQVTTAKAAIALTYTVSRPSNTSAG
jgi:magnesium chelatase family protein